MFTNSISKLFSFSLILMQMFLCSIYFYRDISPQYILAGEFFIIFCMLFFSKTKIALMLFIFLRPLMDYFKANTDIQLQMSSSLNLAAFTSIMLIGLSLVYILSNKINPFKAPYAGLFCAFLLVSLIAAANSAYKIEGISDWMRLLSLFFLYVLIHNLFVTKEDIRRLLYAVVLSSIIPIAVGLQQVATGKGALEITEYIYNTGFLRTFSTFTHPNMYAFYLVTVFILCFVLFLESKTKLKKIYLGILCSLMCSSLLFTYTRGAWIALICAMLIMAGFRYRKIFIGLIIVIVVISTFLPVVSQRINDLLDPSSRELGSFSWRMHLWRETVEHFFSKPFFGHGLGSFYNLSFLSLGYYAQAHNDYLRLALETGIFGLGIYLVLFFSLIKESLNVYKRLRTSYFKAVALGFISICMAYLFISMCDNLLRATVVQIYFWTLAAVTFNLIKAENRLTITGF